MKKMQMNFQFKEVSIEDTQKKELRLYKKKVYENSDIPPKTIKENVNIFAEYLYSSINDSINHALNQQVLNQFIKSIKNI